MCGGGLLGLGRSLLFPRVGVFLVSNFYFFSVFDMWFVILEVEGHCGNSFVGLFSWLEPLVSLFLKPW